MKTIDDFIEFLEETRKITGEPYLDIDEKLIVIDGYISRKALEDWFNNDG